MWTLRSEVDNQETWAYAPQVLTPEQCKEVIRIGESLLPKTASTFGGTQLEVRDSKVSWIEPSEETIGLFRHMTDVVVNLNTKFFNFDLVGFAEGFQFTKYEAPAGKYDLHIDKAYKGVIRKLSIVVQLSDPSDYEGGDLVIQSGNDPVLVPKQQGFLTAFPSYVLHGVQPVTKGTRYSLVAWLTGPQFK